MPLTVVNRPGKFQLTLPLKQGLKQEKKKDLFPYLFVLAHTSTKTRIETKDVQPNSAVNHTVLAHTSTKTRIETRNDIKSTSSGDMFQLTLPLKQGLKQTYDKTGMLSEGVVLAHTSTKTRIETSAAQR